MLKRPKSGPPEVVAEGRGAWIGWLELKTEPVDEVATQMTAKVIQDVNADILAVVEADDRIGLVRFNEQLLKPLKAAYGSIMLIEGNDERGIDVGLLTKPSYPIESVVSHVDDMGRKGTLFLSELTDTFRFQEGFPNELHQMAPKSLPDSPSLLPPCDKKTADVRHTGHKVPLISFDPEFVPSIPRSITWCNVPGVSNLGCLGIMSRYPISPICQVNSETTSPLSRHPIPPHYEEMTNSAQAASDHAAIWADINL